MCHGFSQAFGEATLMGYLKGLPSDLVMTFGSGTGVSGFTGVLSVLFLQALGVSQGRAFLVLALFVIPYFVAFSWVDDKRKLYIKDEQMYPDLMAQPIDENGTIVEEKGLKAEEKIGGSTAAVLDQEKQLESPMPRDKRVYSSES